MNNQTTNSKTMTERFIHSYTSMVIKYRWWFVALVMLIVGLSSFGLPKLYFDNTTNSFFKKGDPTLEKYERFLKKFDTDEYIVILLDAPQTWNTEYFQFIRNLENEIAALPNVKRVTSIANAEYIHNVDGDLVVDEFIPQGQLDEKTLADKKTYALQQKFFKSALVNGDGSKITILLETTSIAGEISHKIALTQAMTALEQRPELQKLHFQFAGAPVLDSLVLQVVTRESALFGLLVFALLAIGFYLVFRSAMGVILPLGIASLANLAAFGIMGTMDAPIGILSSIIPSFLLSVGTASSVFLLTEIYGSIVKGKTVEEALFHTMATAAIPCLLSAITTAGALLAFSFSDVRAVMNVGLTMGIGLLISIVFTLILVPVAFSFVKQLKTSEKRNQIILERVGGLEKISEFVISHYRRILPVFVIAAALASWGFLQLNVDYYYLGMFKPESSIRTATAAIDKEFGNASAIEIVLQSKNAGDIKEPAVMQFIEKLGAAAESYDRAPVKSYSIVDIVKDVNKALHEGNPDFYKLPLTRDGIAQSILLFEMGGGTELNRLIADDYATARLTLYIPNLSVVQNRDIVNYLNQYMTAQIGASHDPLIRNLKVEVTGLVALWETINNYLADSQIKSMLIAMLIVGVVMTGLFRSILLGIFMTLSNMFVVICVLGVMGWQGIALDPYTILIGAIALGILDDDTIHFVKNFQYEYNLTGCAKTAIKHTFRSSGQAIFYTTTVMTLAFLVYTLSEMASLNLFGLVTSMTIALGMIVEFLLTPSLLLLFHEGRPKLSKLEVDALPKSLS